MTQNQKNIRVRPGQLLHIEAPGAIINIRPVLRDDEGHQVTSIEIQADGDRYMGEKPWWCPDIAAMGGSPTGGNIRIVQGIEKPPVGYTQEQAKKLDQFFARMLGLLEDIQEGKEDKKEVSECVREARHWLDPAYPGGLGYEGGENDGADMDEACKDNNCGRLGCPRCYPGAFNETLWDWLNRRNYTRKDWPHNLPESVKAEAEAAIGGGRKLDQNGWPITKNKDG